MAKVGIAASDVDGIKGELKRNDAALTGSSSGYVSVQYTKEKLDKLQETADKADQKAKENTGKPAGVGMYSYAQGGVRDAVYACRGRKFMRIAGINARNQAAYGRLVAILGAEMALKK